MPLNVEKISSNRAFGGEFNKYKFNVRGTATQFNVFVPAQSSEKLSPVIYYFAGLTCNEDTGAWKGGFIRDAADEGIALVFPDTSPRGAGVEGEDESWDFGSGAGFYINATNGKWSKHYNINAECQWGRKAFSGYLNGGQEEGKANDATELIGAAKGKKVAILADYGDADKFYQEKQLLPENFIAAAKQAGFDDSQVQVRAQPGYDHSYYFVSTFAPEHIKCVGLALVCALKGYPVIITLPEKMSLEKEVALRALGAEVVRTPTNAPSQGEESNIGVAKRLERTIPGGVILDQYSNPNNPLAHEFGTGPEIIHAITSTPSTPERPSSGKIDVLVAGAGTGGTVTGLSNVIKREHNPDCVIVGVDPIGSLLAGPSKEPLGGYMVEGIGYDFVPDVLNYTNIDAWEKVLDSECFPMAREIIRTEGMLVGGSSGAAVSGALKFLKSKEGFEKFGNVEGKNVVIILPDSIRNYMSKDWFADAIKAEPPTEMWGRIQEALEKTKPQKGHASGSGVASNVATAKGIAPAVNGYEAHTNAA
ncbi:cystathionine beta-synthase [Tulasnella sp. 427]|nr:cystathionine beta-synthase [Tulasnella sp. 427]